jgi:DNA mismatch repair protein MutS2
MPTEIITSARAELSPTDLHAEDLLDEIHRQRDLSRQARQAAEQARDQAEKLRLELSERLEQIEDERREVLEKARSEAGAEVQSLQDDLRELRRLLARARQPLDALQIVEQKVAELEESVEVPIERQAPRRQVASLADAILNRPVRLGDKVRLRTLNTHGVVTSIGEEEAEIQVGMLRVRTRLNDLQPIAENNQATQPEASPARDYLTTSSTSLPASPGFELDLRGRRADDALEVLERYLDSAYLAGLPFARIIHGKGTGKLRQAVREALQNHPHVGTFEAGGDKEGGEGVTVAKLKTA